MHSQPQRLQRRTHKQSAAEPAPPMVWFLACEFGYQVTKHSKNRRIFDRSGDFFVYSTDLAVQGSDDFLLSKHHFAQGAKKHDGPLLSFQRLSHWFPYCRSCRTDRDTLYPTNRTERLSPWSDNWSGSGNRGRLLWSNRRLWTHSSYGFSHSSTVLDSFDWRSFSHLHGRSGHTVQTRNDWRGACKRTKSSAVVYLNTAPDTYQSINDPLLCGHTCWYRGRSDRQEWGHRPVSSHWCLLWFFNMVVYSKWSDRPVSSKNDAALASLDQSTCWTGSSHFRCDLCNQPHQVSCGNVACSGGVSASDHERKKPQ